MEYDRAAGASREEMARRLGGAASAHLVKPFDDALVIAGQGSVGLEMVEQAEAAGLCLGADVLEVAVCCGGGGLSAGVALGVEPAGLRVRPVEPAGFDDWARSLAAGERCENAAPVGSICDAILTPQPGEITWAIGRRLFGPGVAVSDDDARRAMAAAARHLKIVLEPGGAVALAAALFQPEAFAGDSLLVVASGGNVDPDAYLDWTRVAEWSAEGLPLRLGDPLTPPA